MSDPTAYQGFQSQETFGSQFNAQTFLIQSILSTVHTCTLVKVISCTNDSGLSPVGTVNVQPLVNQVDGAGNQTEHAVIYACPYFRLQGGANAVIIDPVKGDIGIAVFADRDISNVITTKAQSNPGSNSRFNMGDGLYIGGVLNGTPTQYVRFSPSGVNITSTGKITLTDGSGSMMVMNNDNTGKLTFAGGLTVNNNLQVNGTVKATGEGTFNSIDVSVHTHSVALVQSGSSTKTTTGPAG